MKYHIIVCYVFIIWVVNTSADQSEFEWKVVPYPFSPDTAHQYPVENGKIKALNDHEAVYFKGGKTIWLIKSDGDSIIEKNICDPSLYVKGTYDTCFPFNVFDFADSKTGYIAGGNSTIYKTVDGGETWKSSLRGEISGNMGSGPIYQSELLCISAYTPENVWAAGKSGLILHSTDGGNNWQKAKWDSVSFINDNVYDHLYYYEFKTLAVVNDTVSFVTGEYKDMSIILMTTDGGRHWKEISTLRFAQKIVSIAYSNSTLWVLLKFACYCGTLDTASNTVIWNTSSIRSYGVEQLSFILINSMNIMTIDRTDDYNYITYSMPSQSSHQLKITSISSSNSGVFWGASRLGMIYRSLNKGILWNCSIKNGVYSKVRLNTVYFIDPNNGFIGGDYGVLLYTNDSGKTWIPYGPSVCASASFKSFKFSNNVRGWAASSEYFFFTTSDGGKSWALADSITSAKITLDFIAKECYQISQDTILEVDEIDFEGKIVTMVNGKRLLLAVVDHSDSRNNNFSDITFSSDTTGWVVGSNGLVLKSSDHGATWKRVLPFTQSDLKKINFINPSRGFILGDNNIFLTDDGGSTWKEPPFLSGNINDFAFSDTANCWVVGNDGLIINLKIGTTPTKLTKPIKYQVASAGDSLAIRWQGLKVDKFKIMISYDNGRNLVTYNSETINDGEETISISANAVPGDSCIVVFCNLDGTEIVRSEIFTIQGYTNTLSSNKHQCNPGIKIRGSIIKFSVSDPKNSTIITIFNSLGKCVLKKSIYHNSTGEKSIQIPEGTLKNGTYYLKMSSGKNLLCKQFVVCR